MMNRQFGMSEMNQMPFQNQMMMGMNKIDDDDDDDIEEWMKGFTMGVQEVNNMQQQKQANESPKRSYKKNYNQNDIFNSINNDNYGNIFKSNINNKKIGTPTFNSEDNKKYINQIEELKKELLKEKENNNELRKENKKLEEIINSSKKENIDLKKKLEKEINKLKENIKQLNNELNSKNKELNNKKDEIQNYILEINDLKENKNQITFIKPGEKIFSVLFMTQGNNDIFNYAMTCKNTELFVRLEERLYADFPEYKKVEIIFMVDARRILRFQTLDENKIKRNDIISLFVVDSE